MDMKFDKNNTKRIFEPEVAFYLFTNGATMRGFERDKKNEKATLFYFEENEILYELLANKKS